MPRVAGRFVALLFVMLSVTSCGGGTLVRQYEYEEETYLALNGTASVYVNASIPALVALRGVDLDVRPRARLDRARIRAMYEGPGVRVIRVSASRRHNRRFVHLRLDVADVRRLSDAAPFAWSRYALDRRADLYVFRQTVGPSAGRSVGDVGWNGEELIAFRLHLPSKIQYHNTKPGNLRRGNILVWEQRLTDGSEDGNPVHPLSHPVALCHHRPRCCGDVRAGHLVDHAPRPRVMVPIADFGSLISD